MKIIIKSLIVLSLALASQNTFAQEQDTTITVNGVCNMCKRIIEKSSYLDGVSSAEWDVKTKELKLTYNPEEVTLASINESIVKSGYDTEYSTASDEDYEKLHGCCHYRDPKVVKDHEDQK